MHLTFVDSNEDKRYTVNQIFLLLATCSTVHPEISIVHVQ